jgi:hypothetical protein
MPCAAEVIPLMTDRLHEGLKALIERESARRLARLGGTQSGLKAAPRRRGSAKV